MRRVWRAAFARAVAHALAGVAGFVLAAASVPLAAQEAPRPTVGQPAPGFALAGATREGVRPAPVRLSDYRGKTVVLAFFYKARTKG